MTFHAHKELSLQEHVTMGFLHNTEPINCYELLQYDINELSSRSVSKHLKFNPGKYKMMIIFNGNNTYPTTDVKRNSPIQIGNHMWYFGVNITSDLNWSAHIHTITSKDRGDWLKTLNRLYTLP